MTTIAPTNISFFARHCPCDCTKITQGLDSALPWVGIAVSVIGVATMIFSSSWPAAIGFAICGLIFLHSRFCGDTREISELKVQMDKADQQLIKKQEEITSVTKKLTELQHSTQKTQHAFDKQLDTYKGANQTLEKIVKELPNEQPKLARRNKKLEKTVAALTQQVEESKAMAKKFEKEIHNFITEHQKVIPQLDQLSEAAKSLEGSEQRLRGTLSGFNQELAQGMESFAIRLRAWQLTTDKVIHTNKTLNGEITQLKSAIKTEQETAHQLKLACETLSKGKEERAAHILHLTQLLDELKEQNRIAEQLRR